MAGRLQRSPGMSRTGFRRIFVKTRILSLSSVATLAIALGMMTWGSTLHAQDAPTTAPDRQAQQPSSSPDTTPSQSTPQTTPTPPPSTPDAQSPDNSQTPSSQTPSSQSPDAAAPTSRSSESNSAADTGAATGTQTFSGTVVKQGDKYVLKDDAGKTYDIDHQDEVKKFDGKRVRVQGTLDPSTNKIMVK